MNHWETHLYTYAVALTQGDRIKPENLAGMRAKAIKHGHTEADCAFVESNTRLYIAKGVLAPDPERETVAVTAQFFYDCPTSEGVEGQKDMVHGDLMRLLDADSTTRVACSAVSVQSLSSDKAEYRRARIHMVCGKCGSTDVRADAFSAWDAAAAQWVLHATYDQKYCEKCDCSTNLLEIYEASQLEIQAFGMITDKHGSRIVQDGETPDFFDVMVSTTPLEGGVILSLEEHEDMSAEEAAWVLSAMVETYPTAAISSVNCDLGGL